MAAAAGAAAGPSYASPHLQMLEVTNKPTGARLHCPLLLKLLLQGPCSILCCSVAHSITSIAHPSLTPCSFACTHVAHARTHARARAHTHTQTQTHTHTRTHARTHTWRTHGRQQVEFIAEEEEVEIIPNFDAEPFRCSCSLSLHPFIPSSLSLSIHPRTRGLLPSHDNTLLTLSALLAQSHAHLVRVAVCD
jgi:hypothetical protein